MVKEISSIQQIKVTKASTKTQGKNGENNFQDLFEQAVDTKQATSEKPKAENKEQDSTGVLEKKESQDVKEEKMEGQPKENAQQQNINIFFSLVQGQCQVNLNNKNNMDLQADTNMPSIETLTNKSHMEQTNSVTKELLLTQENQMTESGTEVATSAGNQGNMEQMTILSRSSNGQTFHEVSNPKNMNGQQEEIQNLSEIGSDENAINMKASEQSISELEGETHNQLKRTLETQAVGQSVQVEMVESDSKNKEMESPTLLVENTEKRIESFMNRHTIDSHSLQSSIPTVTIPDDPSMGETIASHIVKNIQVGKQQLELQLNPENLGKLSIHITYENGKTSVSILCSSKETAQALAQQVKEIGQIMEQNLKAPTTIIVDTPQAEPDYLEQQENENHHNQEQQQEQTSRQQRKQEETSTRSFLEQLRLGLA